MKTGILASKNNDRAASDAAIDHGKSDLYTQEIIKHFQDCQDSCIFFFFLVLLLQRYSCLALDSAISRTYLYENESEIIFHLTKTCKEVYITKL